MTAYDYLPTQRQLTSGLAWYQFHQFLISLFYPHIVASCFEPYQNLMRYHCGTLCDHENSNRKYSKMYQLCLENVTRKGIFDCWVNNKGLGCDRCRWRKRLQRWRWRVLEENVLVTTTKVTQVTRIVRSDYAILSPMDVTKDQNSGS